MSQEPLSNSKAFPSPFFTLDCVVACQQVAIFAAQLKVGLQPDGKAMTTGDAAIHTLPFQLGLGEAVIQGCFNCWLVC